MVMQYGGWLRNVALNFFGSEQEDLAISPLKSYLDSDGIYRINTPNLASYNFDGMIPTAFINYAASAIAPGMEVSFTGSADAQSYYTILGVWNEDESLSGSYEYVTVIEYLDENSEFQSVVYGASSVLTVRYEDWENKYLGTTGWYLTNAGNAIFSNVAVRGEIEATEGTLNNIVAESGNVKKLSIGAGKTFEYVSIAGTASGGPGRESGNFILSMPSSPGDKMLSPGDYFYTASYTAVSGSVRGITNPDPRFYFNNVSVDEDGFWSGLTFTVLTASYNDGSYDRYFCRYVQGSLFTDVDFSDISASGGLINLGYLYLGEFVSTLGTGINIDGLVLSTIGPTKFSEGYIPDYIDLSGEFKLGRGKLTFDGTNLNIDGNINARSGSFTGVITASFGRIAGFTLGDVSGTRAIKSANDRVVLREDGTIILTGAEGDPLYLSGAIPGWRIFSGTSGPTARFSVNDQGGLKAISASIIGGLYGASVSGGIISSGSFVGGILQSPTYSGVTDGSAFSTTGTHFNLNIGTITSKQFRIQSDGSAFFAGSLSSGVSISAPVISGGSISGNSISGGSISSTSISSTDITGGIIRTATTGQRISINSTGTNFISFNTGNVNESNAGYINTVNNAGTDLQLNFVSPTWTGKTPAQVNLMSQSVGSQVTIVGDSILNIGNTKISGALTGENNIEMRQVQISTSAPSSPGNYRAGTLWAVI